MSWSLKMLKKQQPITILMVLLISGCMGDTTMELVDIPPVGFREKLRAGMLFDFDPMENNSAEIQASLLRSKVSELIELPLKEGTVELSAGRKDSSQVDVLTIALTIVLEDVFVPASVFPPSGIDLTEISLEIQKKTEQAIELSWSQKGDLGNGSFTTDLVLHWSVARDDRVIGLSDVIIRNASIHITIDALNRSHGSTDVALSIQKLDAFWRWADTFEFRDLGLEMSGYVVR